MAYIGSGPEDTTTGARPRDEYLGNGVQYIYPLGQQVPGGFESGLIVVVDNVVQEPVEAYLISDLVLLSITNIAGTITTSKYIRIGSAEGIIVQSASTFVRVYKTTPNANFTTGSAIIANTSGGTSVATATISAVAVEENKGLHFTGVPEAGQNIYALHQGGSTYQLQPAAGSVTAETLSANLKAFTVDKFVATQGQTVFNLSQVPASIQSIIVTANGSVYTDNVDFSLTGTTLTLAVGLSAGVKVTVFHLGFGTVSRNAFTDGSVSTRALEDLSVTTTKLAASAVTGPKLANGAIAASLGYTPLNKAGDTVTGTLTVNNLILGTGTSQGRIQFPSNSFPSADPYTLDDYQEGDWFPILEINNATTGIVQAGTTYGTFTKMGNRVFCTGRIVLTNKGSLTGTVKISGIPFAVANEHIAQVAVINGSSVGSTLGRLSNNSGLISLVTQPTSGAFVDVTNTNITNTTELFFNFMYQSND
jgi:hypothetical protein